MKVPLLKNTASKIEKVKNLPIRDQSELSNAKKYSNSYEKFEKKPSISSTLACRKFVASQD